MQSISMKAHAKINVGLDVIGKRADGYHELRTVMQTVGLYDTLFIKRIDKRTLKLVTNLKWLPTDERNLVYRAAEFLLREYNIESGAFIELHKNVPVCAGLGGGSSDCAAALVGMRNLFNLPISNTELVQLAANFGADVPYCVIRGTALATGIGENLCRLPPHPHAYVLLAKPPASISTPAVFGSLDLAIASHPDIDAIMDGIRNRNITAIASALGNTLEPVTAAELPIVLELKRIMLDNGALGSQMSGSGPTVFGYYTDRDKMRAAADAIACELPQVREIHRTYIHNP